MNYSNQSQILESKIINLEKKKRENLKALTIQLETTYQELRPSRLLLRAINDIKEVPEVKGNLFEMAVSLTGGYLSKKIFVGKSSSMFKNIFGYAFQYFITKIILTKIK